MNELSQGMSGIPLPYDLRSDWMVTGILLVCFILVSHILSKGKKHLLQKFKSFTSKKERPSLFDESTSSDARYTLVLIIQTCVLSSLCIYNYFSEQAPQLFSQVPHHVLLGTYLGFTLAYFVIKWTLYNCINWIFFDKKNNTMWMEAYVNIIIGAGFLLFPLVLLIIYFNLSSQIALYFTGFLLIFSKILLFYKSVNNFFHKIDGTFHLILYFCTLEVIPILVLWKGISIVNNILVLNF